MSDRLDVVVVTDEGAAIHHQRWGATALWATLLDGPKQAVTLAREYPRTEEIDDILAGCVIDTVRQHLVIAGPADMISRAGPRPAIEDEILRELAPLWPGWRLAYEPAFVLEAVVLYVRGLGLALRALNQPHTLSDYLGEPRYAAPAYTLDAAADAGPPAVVDAPAEVANALAAREIANFFDLSVRAVNELSNAGFTTFGEVLGLDHHELARRGISEKVRRELTEYVAWASADADAS